MQYPNKLYLFEYESTSYFGDKFNKIIICVADNEYTARKEIGKMYSDMKSVNPIWLMNAVYPKIYDQKGNKELDIQFRILSNKTINNYD